LSMPLFGANLASCPDTVVRGKIRFECEGCRG
jgi:hypothetical protein